MNINICKQNNNKNLESNPPLIKKKDNSIIEYDNNESENDNSFKKNESNAI